MEETLVIKMMVDAGRGKEFRLQGPVNKRLAILSLNFTFKRHHVPSNSVLS